MDNCDVDNVADDDDGDDDVTASFPGVAYLG